LHDESFTAKEADAHPALKSNSQGDTARSAKEAVLLTQQRATHLRQLHGDDLAWIRRGESDAPLYFRFVVKNRSEQRLACDQTLARAQQLAEQAALLSGAVTEHRVHLDTVLHHHHGAGFTDRCLARVELDLDVLHVIAKNLEINFVHRHCLLRNKRYEREARRGAQGARGMRCEILR
jgi:hypothetical protein